MYIDHISQKLNAEYRAGLADVIKNNGEGSTAHANYISDFLAREVYGKEQLEFILSKYMFSSGKGSLLDDLFFLEAITFGNPKFNFS